MKRHRALLSLLCLACLATTPFAQQSWPQWRGPLGTGAAPEAHPPLAWSEEHNVRWKSEIPGIGDGSPIVWGEHVFVLTAIPVGAASQPDAAGDARRGRRIAPEQKQRFTVLAFERSDGSLAWEALAREALPHEGTHGDASWASASALTDGEQLFAFFGSNGLFAYDMQGNKLWEKDLGKMTTRNGFGEGASPALHGNTLVVPWDHEGPSFVVALDKRTGAELWRRERDAPTSWATPVIVVVNDRPQVLVNGSNRIHAYDLASGADVWECGGMTLNAIPTPVIDPDGVAYFLSGFRGSALLAIDLARAKGDVTDGEAILWSRDRDTPYVPSPLLYGDTLYFLKTNSGILTALDTESGAEVFGPTRLESVSNVYASPVGAAGRVYLVDREGTTEVLAHGPAYEVLATNTLDDAFDASPALADGELYLRGARYLYCIAEDAAEGADD